MALYIPYIAGSSFAFLASKGFYSYFYNDTINESIDNLDINNEFLTKNLDIIEKEVSLDNLEDDIEIKMPVPEFLNDKDDEKDIPFPELVESKDIEKTKKSVKFTIEDKCLATCIKCKVSLPYKCFSKSQKKKPQHVWKCKVCTKLQ